MQSSADVRGPNHVAIIMDGNGRWARARGMPRSEGHRRGAGILEGILQSAGDLDVRVLTLYAFSSDNWRRPATEIEGLLRLFRRFLHAEARRCRERGVRLQVIGRRDRLPLKLLEAVRSAERVTRDQRGLLVRVAIDYSSRWAIHSAAARATGEEFSISEFRRALALVTHSDPVRDPDLVVRTGGEQRLSDFLLWESAYAELVFVPCMWPEFTAEDLCRVVTEYRSRQRRFGGLPAGDVETASRASRERRRAVG